MFERSGQRMYWNRNVPWGVETIWDHLEKNHWDHGFFYLSSVFSEWVKNNHQNIIGSKIHGGRTDKMERSGKFSA